MKRKNLKNKVLVLFAIVMLVLSGVACDDPDNGGLVGDLMDANRAVDYACGILLILLSELLKHYMGREYVRVRMEQWCGLDKSCRPW